MIKIEGHTHTELCPHGSGESTVKMIERAIKLGFTEYYITEHAPLPDDFIANYAGDPENVQTAALRWDQLDEYFSLGRKLQQQFKDQIKITVGFEIDYLEDYETEISEFLEKVGSQTENNIISVHYLKNQSGRYYGIDYSPEELEAGFRNEIQNGQLLYQCYLQTVLKSVKANFASISKIGHMSLIKKYQDFFSLPYEFSTANIEIVKEILANAKKSNLKIDFNTAGLYKNYCNDIYPGQQIINIARYLAIPFEFGSDAHSVTEVGHGYYLLEYFEK